jgi:peptidyl-prolyl cis-trans isomerase SurA
MRNLLAALTIAVLATVPAFPALAAGKEGIAVVVNQDVITRSDVDNRMNLIATSTGMPRTPELMGKLRPQIVEMLIDEQIRIQEARRLKVEVTKEDIDSGFAQIAQNNNIPPEKFRSMLVASKIQMGTMEDQIRAQIAWGKVIQKRLRPQIEISDADIDSELEMIRAKIGKAEYLVANIFLPVNEQKNDGDVSTLASRLVSQIRENPSLFPRIAQQFSQAPGAAQGGMIGWISEGQLATEIDARLPTLEVNQISEPIKTMTGYNIVMVREKRQITEETLPDREAIIQRLGLERLDRAQRRYMMDLRSSAYIESRAS